MNKLTQWWPSSIVRINSTMVSHLASGYGSHWFFSAVIVVAVYMLFVWLVWRHSPSLVMYSFYWLMAMNSWIYCTHCVPSICMLLLSLSTFHSIDCLHILVRWEWEHENTQKYTNEPIFGMYWCLCLCTNWMKRIEPPTRLTNQFIAFLLIFIIVLFVFVSYYYRLFPFLCVFARNTPTRRSIQIVILSLVQIPIYSFIKIVRTGR